MEYRKDIQFYRGVAVIIVVLFHLGVGLFNTGFLGVDIFFVISGFLMQKLYREDSTAVDFYNRRARRLLPAYFATIIISIILASAITLPGEFNQVVEQSFWSAALLPNLGFWLQNSYFSKSDFNPLLNLWSLGVEIQFYLIIPVLIVITRKRNWFLCIIVFVSLVLCLSITSMSPKTSFFMMPLRIWEFGIGMLVARSNRKPVPSAGIASVCVMFGMVFVPVDGQNPSALWGHPGLGAVVITLATGGALLWRLPDAMMNNVVSRALVALGDVSYSVYLAHFPVLVLAHYRPFSGTILAPSSYADFAMSLALIAVASAIIYLAVERNSRALFSPRYGALAVVLVVTLGIGLPKLQIMRFDQRDRQIFAALNDRAAYRCGQKFRITHPGSEICPLADQGKPILLIGDSHSDSIKTVFADTAVKAGYRTYFAVRNDTLLAPSVGAEWLVRQAKSVNARAVYLHFSRDNVTPKLIQTAKASLDAAGVQIIWIEPVPEYSEPVLKALYRENHGITSLKRQTIHDYRKDNESTFGGLSGIDLIRIPTGSILCTPVCKVRDQRGKPLYFDGDHLTLTGAALLRPALARDFDKIQARSWGS